MWLIELDDRKALSFLGFSGVGAADGYLALIATVSQLIASLATTSKPIASGAVCAVSLLTKVNSTWCLVIAAR